jgi:hypothetical protein
VWVSTKPLITEEIWPGQGLNPDLSNDLSHIHWPCNFQLFAGPVLLRVHVSCLRERELGGELVEAGLRLVPEVRTLRSGYFEARRVFRVHRGQCCI